MTAIIRLRNSLTGAQEDVSRRTVCLDRNKAAEGIAAASIRKAVKMPDDHVQLAGSAAPAQIRSCSNPAVKYTVTEDSCSCTHAVRGNFCKHRAKLLLLTYDVKPGQLKVVLGTKAGTNAGGLAALRQQYPLRQQVCRLHRSAARKGMLLTLVLMHVYCPICHH